MFASAIRHLAIWIFCLLGSIAPQEAKARAIPTHSSLVIDESGILDPAEQDFLRAALTQFQEKYGPQIQLLIIPSLEGDAIENFSIQVVDAWKLGKKGKDNGVLFLIAHNDHKLRIEVGRGLEGDLPDALAGRILDQGVRPYFRAERYADGIRNGLQMIATALGGELSGIEMQGHRGGRQARAPIPLVALLILFVLFMMHNFSNRMGPGRRYYGGGWGSGGLGGGWGSGGGGGFGGGFGGGGGGGFSGGGASSDW